TKVIHRHLRVIVHQYKTRARRAIRCTETSVVSESMKFGVFILVVSDYDAGIVYAGRSRDDRPRKVQRGVISVGQYISVDEDVIIVVTRYHARIIDSQSFAATAGARKINVAEIPFGESKGAQVIDVEWITVAPDDYACIIYPI